MSGRLPALTLGQEGGREEGRAALAPALSPGANLGLARAETGQAAQDLKPPSSYLSLREKVQRKCVKEREL